MKKIALIIPTLNELENIEKLVKEIKLNLENVTIFIIDDSKEDNQEDKSDKKGNVSVKTEKNP